jgi:hypothetical protein
VVRRPWSRNPHFVSNSKLKKTNRSPRLTVAPLAGRSTRTMELKRRRKASSSSPATCSDRKIADLPLTPRHWATFRQGAGFRRCRSTGRQGFGCRPQCRVGGAVRGLDRLVVSLSINIRGTLTMKIILDTTDTAAVYYYVRAAQKLRLAYDNASRHSARLESNELPQYRPEGRSVCRLFERGQDQPNSSISERPRLAALNATKVD